MTRGFVFGKFLPFHKGHEALIRFAMSRCDLVTVIVCASSLEKISGSVRAGWIRQTIGGSDKVDLKVFEYSEQDLPNTSVSSEHVSRVWADKFKEILPDQDLVFTSEPYGEWVASFMGIRHVLFDMDRTNVSISGTALRDDLGAYWKYLPDPVKKDLMLKVAVLGTESTGKSTLSLRLAAHFGAALVTEAGRDIVPDSRDFLFSDLKLVAEEHARRIDAAIGEGRPVLVMDTDIHITMSYARFVFGRELEVPGRIRELNKAHLYLYLHADAPYHQDGTRLDITDRDRLDRSHRQVLEDSGIRPLEIVGDWDERFLAAVRAIEAKMSAFFN